MSEIKYIDVNRATQIIRLHTRSDQQVVEGLKSVCRGYKMMGKSLQQWEDALKQHFYQSAQFNNLPTMMQELLNTALASVDWASLAEDIWRES